MFVLLKINIKWWSEYKKSRIVSVGRKYFEVGEEKGGRFNIKFHIEDNRQFTDYMSDWEIYFSVQKIYDQEESEKIESELRMKFRSWGKTDLSLDQLRGESRRLLTNKLHLKI